MSLGTGFLAAVVAASFFVTLFELWQARRFRGPAFSFGLELRTASLASLAAKAGPPVGANGPLQLAPDRRRFLVRARPPLGLPNPIFAAGSVVGEPGKGLVQVRLALGGPTLLASSAVACGHLSGKLNPFFQNPVTPEFAAMAATAALLVLLTWWSVRLLLRAVDVSLDALRAELDRKTD